MGAAKRQGREKFTKIEQRKVKGRSEDWGEDLRWNKQHPRLARFPQGRPGEEENIQKRSEGLGLSPARWHTPPLASLRVFGSACPHDSRMEFPALS